MDENTEDKPLNREEQNNVQENGSHVKGEYTNKDVTNKKNRWKIGIWQLVIIVLVVVCVILLITLISVAVVKNKELEESKVPTCGGHTGVIDISEQSEPSVFSDLTAAEVKGLTEYLYNNKELNLVRPSEAKVNKNYMFLAELYLPNKKDAVAYLDGDTVSKPVRQAKVVLFRGNETEPEIQEIVVSPLPNPAQFTVLREKIPFTHRPVTGPELGAVLFMITAQAHDKISDLLSESFGGKVWECGDRCLVFRYITPVSSALSGEKKRLIWFWLSQDAELYILHPLDFAILVEMDGPNYKIVNVWYNGHAADSLETLKRQYDSGTIDKQRVPFPQTDDTLFSKMTRRGPAFPESGQRPPVQVEPDGKRYSIKGRQVTYMNWRFDFRMSTSMGPQVYDIRYQNKRIVYELGLQEIAVFYSGHKPTMMFANFFDSVGLIGPQGKGLVPGVDCPAHATFLPSSHLLEGSDKLISFENVLCVFEQDTGMPIRRHHSYSSYHGIFYEGMPGHVLTLRTMVTVANYDYILDFIFYQNGAIETKAVSTGYILANAFTEKEKDFGPQVHKYIAGNLHHHLFSFKADLDINGIKNRYDTMDISTTQVPNQFNPDPNAKITMAKYARNQKAFEKAAAYKFNFDTPKYHIFYNNLVNNNYGNPKSYRVLMKGISKQILPENEGNEPAGAWSRYQMAVTKHSDKERTSSSLYAIFDAEKPVVDFQSYIDNNDTLTDEDLVAWISLGIQHIPHTEDLPVTHTPGMDLSFFLLPYNYFPEDPSMASRDSVRIEPKTKNNANVGINFIRHSKPRYKRCLPKKNMYQELLQKNPGILFEYGSGGGTAI
ncbi:hypothetical protein FSP39_015608 [Pinctada imbricata]|uniref:Amine oxidase n=1 Tax=Pinctada imbricata TaxID=66713 RepID=A0AA89C1B0_PINIB|nr:hypothetical protein FSP39_015608 [Pinctada imbricata]